MSWAAANRDKKLKADPKASTPDPMKQALADVRKTHAKNIGVAPKLSAMAKIIQQKTPKMRKKI